MHNLEGQIRCIMGDVQVTNPAILREQAWSIKYLFYCQIIHNGLSCCYLVFSRVGRPPRHWFISFSRLPFPASFASTLNVPMVFCSQPHEQLTVKATEHDEGNHFRLPKPVLLFKTILKLTAPWMAPFGERRSAEREVTGSNLGRTNTQRVFK